MGFITIYNDPLNSKVHVFRAMCIWKPYMKNIPYPLPMGGFLKTIFLDNLLYIYLISASLHSRY